MTIADYLAFALYMDKDLKAQRKAARARGKR